MRPSAATLAVTATALAGCGASRPTPEQEVRTVLTTFATAAEERDYRRICDRVLAPALLSGLQEIGLPCEVALRNSLGQVEEPRLTVGRIEVEDARATAEVRTSARGQQPSTDTVELERVDGEWRIGALSTAAKPRPPATPRSSPAQDEKG